MIIKKAGRVGALVKQRREELHMTQEDLADRVGRSQRWVSALETGRIGMPRTGTLHAMAEALQIRVADFYIAATLARTAAEGERIARAAAVLATVDLGSDQLIRPDNHEADIVAIVRQQLGKNSLRFFPSGTTTPGP